MRRSLHGTLLFAVLGLAIAGLPPWISTSQTQAPQTPSRAKILRGEYGRYRANNDLLYYHLDVRVDPEKKFLKGSTLVRFKVLKSDNRIQLDLHEALKVDRILLLSGSDTQGPKSKVQSPKTE